MSKPQGFYTPSRRQFLVAGISLGTTMLASACSSEAPASPPPAATSAPVASTPAPAPAKASSQSTAVPAAPVAQANASQSSLKGTLSWWGPVHHPLVDTAAGFQKHNPDVKLDWQHPTDWKTKFKATLASGTNVPDLMWMEAFEIQDLGSKDVLLDLTERIKPIKDQFSPGKLAETFLVKKQQYVAMPGDTGLVGLWYRPDVLAKAGLKDFTPDLAFDPDFLNYAGEIHQKAGASAFFFPSAGYAQPFEIFLAQLGGSITSSDGSQVTVDDDKGVAAMNLVKSLWQTKANLDTTFQSPDYWGAIKAGKLASDFMPAWMRGFIETEVKTAADGAGQWRLMPLPTLKNGESRTAQIGGASLISTKFTKVPDLVWSFMQYSLGSMEGCTIAGNWGIIPAYLPYLGSSAFTDIKSPLFGDFQFAKVWAQLAKELSPKYARTAVFGEADTEITNDIMPILQGKTTVVEGMHTMADKIRQANQRYQS